MSLYRYVYSSYLLAISELRLEQLPNMKRQKNKELNSAHPPYFRNPKTSTTVHIQPISHKREASTLQGVPHYNDGFHKELQCKVVLGKVCSFTEKDGLLQMGQRSSRCWRPSSEAKDLETSQLQRTAEVACVLS